MVRISEVSFKIFKIARFYDLDHITTTTIITTGDLQKFQDGLQILAVRVEEISQEELYAGVYVFTHLRGLQEKFIYEIRTSGGHIVRFRRSAPLSKTFAQMGTALTLLEKLEVEKLALNACLSEVKPRALGLA